MECIKIGKDRLYISDDIYCSTDGPLVGNKDEMHTPSIPILKAVEAAGNNILRKWNQVISFTSDHTANYIVNNIIFPVVFSLAIGKRSTFERVIESYGKSHGLNGRTFLYAHGSYDDPWTFLDGKEQVNMQDWIDSVDGTTAAIEIASCNPMDREVTAKKSIVMHPRTIMHAFPDFLLARNYRLFIPGTGYINNVKHST